VGTGDDRPASDLLCSSGNRVHAHSAAPLVARTNASDAEARQVQEQLWPEDAMDTLLAQHVTGWLFVAGCALIKARL
jgi:hypothetical protein